MYSSNEDKLTQIINASKFHRSKKPSQNDYEFRLHSPEVPNPKYETLMPQS